LAQDLTLDNQQRKLAKRSLNLQRRSIIKRRRKIQKLRVKKKMMPLNSMSQIMMRAGEMSLLMRRNQALKRYKSKNPN
jgi:hypothetical protein